MTTTLTPLGAVFNAGDLQTGAWIGGKGQVFTSSGTFTIPSGVYALKVTVVGGGGNAGSATGGGSGAGAIKFLTNLYPGNTLTVTRGGVGGTSSVSSGTQVITTITATGGSNGSSAATAYGGAGGAASGGDINSNGTYGGFYTVNNAYGIIYSCNPYVSAVGYTANPGLGALSILGGGPGAGGNANGGAGQAGIVIFEW